MDYLELLVRLHAVLRPRVYLEIGGDFGAALAVSRTRSIAVDPPPQIGPDPFAGKPWLKLYQEPSDEFFRSHTAADVLEGEPLDLAFIDGLHQFAQVVRDLEHVERWSHPRTLALIHDVLPQDAWQPTRAAHAGAWTGDVWRVVPFLEQHRPDLRCWLVDAAPTGVLVIAGLDPTRSGMADVAAAIDHDYPPDGPEYERLVAAWLAAARPISPEALQHELALAPRAVAHCVERGGWRGAGGAWEPGGAAAAGGYRLELAERIRGAHRGRLALRARGMPVLRLRLHSEGDGALRRDLFLDVDHPGAAHHEFGSLWLDADPATGSFALDWEGLLQPTEALTAISIAPATPALEKTDPAPGMAIEVADLALEQIGWPRAGAHLAAGRFPDRPFRPTRRDRSRDAVVLAWRIPPTAAAHQLATYYLGLLSRHHAGSKLFVGVNHGSDPAWTARLANSGLDVELCPVDWDVQIASETAGLLAALRALHRSPETFGLVWFGHTAGAGRATYAETLPARYGQDRRFWSRYDEIDRIFADPAVGIVAPEFALPGDPAPDAGDADDLAALERVYRNVYAPLGIQVRDATYVMRGGIVRAFCQTVGDDFFAADLAAYGVGRRWFATAFPSVATMQGYRPVSLPDRREARSEADERVADALRRWQRDPFAFQPPAMPRS
jgi:hypothetical protein